MIGLILRVIAFLLFLIAACNGTLFGQSPVDLAVWGFAAWVLATILDGYGPAHPWARRT